MAINTNSFIYGITKNLDDANTVTYQSNDNGTIAPISVGKTGGIVTQNLLDVTNSKSAPLNISGLGTITNNIESYGGEVSYNLNVTTANIFGTSQILIAPQYAQNPAPSGSRWFIKNIITDAYFDYSFGASFAATEYAASVSVWYYPSSSIKDNYIYKTKNMPVKNTGTTAETRSVGYYSDKVMGFNELMTGVDGITMFTEVYKASVAYTGITVRIKYQLVLAWIPVGYF